MSPVDTATTLHALRAAAANAERFLARALEPFGVTAGQYELLQAIEAIEASGGGCSELGRRVAAPGPDITRMIDRLLAAGLVARHRNENDRRVVHAVLTEKGRALLAEAAPVVRKAEQTIFGGLAGDQQDTLAELLGGVQRTLDR
ncbi:MAG: MarR family transcriptional regulator [Gemmatimonadetes bacterium]|nr:MarR family transcriptional regulator [Gemmatimonadota bacterium]